MAEKEAPKLKANAETLRKVIKKRESGKARPAKPAIVDPYDADWPKISADAAEAIRGVLHSTITPLKIEKLKISKKRKELKAVKSRVVKLASKEKRRTALNEIKKSLRKEHWEAGNCHRKHIVFGLNSIYRQLEKGQLCAVLVCANISPGFMTQPLVPLCSSRKVPAAAIPDLGNVLQQLLNFKSCTSLGLKVGVESDPSNVFHNLYCTIMKNAPDLKVFENITSMKSCASVVKSAPTKEKQISCEITEKDYSHLYIMKSEKSKKAPKKAEDFISLGSNADNLSSEKVTSQLESPFRVQYKDLKMKNVQPPAKKFRIGAASFESGYVISSVKPNPPT